MIMFDCFNNFIYLYGNIFFKCGYVLRLLSNGWSDLNNPEMIKFYLIDINIFAIKLHTSSYLTFAICQNVCIIFDVI